MNKSDHPLIKFFGEQFFRDAPESPGVYFMFDGDRELLYIGKAGNLKKRLTSYTLLDGGGPDLRKFKLLPKIKEIVWQITENEGHALVREAELIQALRPRWNGSFTGDEPFSFIQVSTVLKRSELQTRFDVLANPFEIESKIYGAFPHLAKGKATFPAGKMKVGYPALLRLLFGVNIDSHRVVVPGKIGGKGFPISFEVFVRDDLVKPLNDLLTGLSARLLTTLAERLHANEAIPNFMRASLESDVKAAKEFFEYGPRALRAFKQRHGLAPNKPVDQATIEERLRSKLIEQLGPFSIATDRALSSR